MRYTTFFSNKKRATERLAFGAVCMLLAACQGKNAADTVRPVRQDITETVFASGTLAPEVQYNLTAQSDGYLSQVNFEENTVVAAGQLLATIDNQSVIANTEAAQAQLAVANFNLTDASPALRQVAANKEAALIKWQQDKAQATRYKALYESNSVAKVEWENAELAAQTSQATVRALEAQYAALQQAAQQQHITQKANEVVNATNRAFNQVKALAAGTVLKRLKQRGDYVRRGDVIAVIGNVQTVLARVQIDEKSMGRVQLGQKALIRLNVLKDSLLEGRVVQILPTFDEASQSFIAKIQPDKPWPFAVVGTQLEANIVIGQKQQVLMIPRRYVQFGNKVKVKGQKEAVSVTTGIVSTEWVEIKQGLTENDIIESIKH